ncbi:MAG: hypothetical protein ACLPY5_12130 [Candidatus Bathyarchaeia archaeon]
MDHSKPRRSSKPPRTQNDSHGRSEGGQLGNQNAVKALVWENGLNLNNPDGLRDFLAEVIRAVWTGKLGTRAASSLNGSLRLMFELCTLPQLEERVTQLEKAKRA